MDYFQVSQQFARDSCKHFDLAVRESYVSELLIAQLHQAVHCVSRMVGSLDCTQTYWKNCAKGWAGLYSGNEHQPSIVLEAIVEHSSLFWHASYGYASCMNNIHNFIAPPLNENLMNGIFNFREDLSRAVP